MCILVYLHEPLKFKGMNGDEWMNELIKEWMNVWRRLMTHFSYDISVNGLIVWLLLIVRHFNWTLFGGKIFLQRDLRKLMNLRGMINFDQIKRLCRFTKNSFELNFVKMNNRKHIIRTYPMINITKIFPKWLLIKYKKGSSV